VRHESERPGSGNAADEDIQRAVGGQECPEAVRPVPGRAGRRHVEGRDGERYTIEIANRSGQRVEAVATVDGLDVMNGRPGTLDNRGYILGPWSSFRIDAQSRSPFVPVPAGRVVSSESTPAGSRVVTALDGPMQGAVIVAGKYSTLTEELEGRRVHVSTYAWAKETEARKLARNVLSICMCLENWLGVPYPFKDLKLIEITDWGWGQAPPGVIFITKEAFLSPGRARLDEETQQTATWASRGINERIAHEVAHGWFPHVAKVVRTEENWLSESFADYASAVCLERTMSDKSRAKFFWERQLQDWKDGARHAGQGASVFLAAHLTDSEKDARTWRDLLYGKGPLVLHALRGELARDAGDEKEGDRLFLTWMRSYVKNFVFKPGETRHLVAILNKITSKDWQPWFERYVYGTDTPQLR
jgi:aminopeptidase N